MIGTATRLMRQLKPQALTGTVLSCCASEIGAKASRLLVVLAVARSMEPAAIGAAAAVLAAGDILKAFSETGAGQRIVAAPDELLEQTCNTAARLIWVWCVGLAIVQTALGGLIWALTDEPLAFVALTILAAEYLVMPLGVVHCARAMRAGKTSGVAAVAAGQVVAANLMTAGLALLWAHPLAMILPRALSAPIWLFGMRRVARWDARPDAGRTPLRPFLAYGSAVLGIELVKAVRLQADKLVVGALLGAEALGVYFFAFNAGLGLATSFSTAFATALFPHLARATDREEALRKGVVLALCLLCPVVLLQALLAPVYVPLIFGPGWAEVAPVVAILCLAAAPAILWSATAQWLRVHARADRELLVTAVLALALILATAIAAPHGLIVLAWTHLGVASVVQLGAAMPTLLRLLPRRRPLSPSPKEA